MKRAWRLIAVVAALTLVPVGGVAASPGDAASLLTYGQLRDAEGRAVPGKVAVLAWPEDGVIESLSEGEEFSTPLLMVSSTDENGRFELRLSPEDVPDGYMSDAGKVDLEVHARGERYEGRYHMSAVYLASDELTGWVDPLAVDLQTGELVVPFENVAQGLRSVVSLNDPLSLASLPATAPMSSFDDTGLEDDEEIIWEDELMRCGMALRTSFHTWSHVADTFPASGQTANADLSVSHSETLGSGVSTTGGYGSWTASGTRSFSSGFSWTSTATSYKRKWGAEVLYGRYQRVCYGQPMAYWSTQARYHTGGVQGFATSESPTWTSCATVGSGTWSRTRTDGSAFSLGTGVKSAGIIGIDLSLSRQWRQNVQINYHQTSSRRVCGSNNSPSIASRVRGSA